MIKMFCYSVPNWSIYNLIEPFEEEHVSEMSPLTSVSSNLFEANINWYKLYNNKKKAFIPKFWHRLLESSLLHRKLSFGIKYVRDLGGILPYVDVKHTFPGHLALILACHNLPVMYSI